MSQDSDETANKLGAKLAGIISTHFVTWERNLQSRAFASGCYDTIFDGSTASRIQHYVSIRSQLFSKLDILKAQYLQVLDEAESELLGEDYVSNANTEFNKTVYFTLDVGKPKDTKVPVNFGTPDTPSPASAMQIPEAMPMTSPITRILEKDTDTASLKEDDDATVPEKPSGSSKYPRFSLKEQKERNEYSLSLLGKKIELLAKTLKTVDECAESDTKARSVVALGLQGTNLDAVQGLSGRDSYLALKTLHEGSVAVSRLNATRDLHSLTLKSLDVAAITHFLNEHLRLVRRCQELNPYSTGFTWESMKLDLCYKLPEEFQPLIISMAGAPDSTTSTYGLMVGIIRNRVSAPSYLQKYGSGSKVHKDNNNKIRRCWECKDPGHTLWTCTAPGAEAKRIKVRAERKLKEDQ